MVINRRQYPELDKLLWDIHCDVIEPEFAFRVYEERWGFVQEQDLLASERALIHLLTQTVGYGIFTPAFGRG